MKNGQARNEVAELKSQLAQAQKEIERLSTFTYYEEISASQMDDIRFGEWEWNVNAEFPLNGPALVNMLGYEVDEVAPEFWRDHIYQEDLPKIYEQFEKHIKSGGKLPFEVRLRFRHRQGHTIHIWGRGKVVQWSGKGHPQKVAGRVVDVTELLQWRSAYRDNSERLKLIVEGSQAGIWERNLLTGREWWSPRFCEMLGYEECEREERSDSLLIHQLVHPADSEEAQQAYEMHLEKGVPYKRELRLQKKDGSYAWFEISGKAARLQGEAVRMAGSLVNIDERKSLEVERREQNYLFKEAEKLSHTGVWRYDVETRQVHWSDEIYRIYHRPVGVPIKLEDALVHTEDSKRQKMLGLIEEARKTGETYEYVNEISTLGGNKKWVKVKGMPKKDEDGQIRQIVGVLQDIDETKLRELELLDLHKELERQNMIFKEAEKVAMMGSSELNFETLELTWSDQVYAMHGMVPGDKLHFESLLQNYAPDSRARFEKALREAREKGKPFELEVQKKNQQQKMIWLKIKGIPIADEDGKFVMLRAVIQDINDIKEKELRLGEQELLLKEASRIAHIGAWRIILATETTIWSEEVYHIHEVPLDFPVSSGIDFYHPESKEEIIAGLTKTVETGEEFFQECKINTGRGNTKWVRIKATAVRNEAGDIYELRGFIQDINDHKLRELQLTEIHDQLQKQNLLLKEAEHIGNLGSWEYKPEHNQLFYSDGMRRIMGVESMENLRELGFENIDQPYRSQLREAFEKAIHHKEAYEMQVRITTPLDQKKWAMVRGTPHPTENVVRGIFLDITELKEKKNALRKYNRELEKQKRLLTQAERMAKLGYWEWLLSSDKATWSEQLYAIFEVPEDFQPTREYSFSHFYTPEAVQELSAAIDHTLETGAPFRVEAQVYTYKNNRKWVRLQGSPLYNSKGKIIGTFGTVQDIDDLKKQSIELQKTSQIIGQQNKRLMGFTQIVSHNLRSHSSNIQTMLDFVNKNKTPEEQETFYQYIRETADSLDETLEHLNEVVKIQADTELKLEQINIEEVTFKILNILEGEIQNSDAHFEFDFQVQQIRCYAPYIESIMLNLVSNSLKYRHPGRDPEISISTRKDTKTGKTLIEVKDNGLGIDMKKHRRKLFGMYKTFHKHPNARGIGLFITRNQVEALKGRIEAKSQKNKGSIFRVYL